MSDQLILPCACTLAEKFHFDEPASSYDLASKLANDHRCDHVGVGDLPDEGCKGCAVFFSNCFDVNKKDFKCKLRSNDQLLLFAFRPMVNAAKFTKTMHAAVEVKSRPAGSLTIEGAINRKGKRADDYDLAHYAAGIVVLHPYSRQFKPNSCWKEEIPVKVRRFSEPVNAFIEVVFDGDQCGGRPFKQSIPLNITVPPENKLAELVQVRGG